MIKKISLVVLVAAVVAAVITVPAVSQAGYPYRSYSSYCNTGYCNYNQSYANYSQPFVLVPVDPYVVSNNGNLYQSIGRVGVAAYTYPGGYANYAEAGRVAPGPAYPAAPQQQAPASQQYPQQPPQNNYLTRDEFVSTMRELMKSRQGQQAEAQEEPEEPTGQPQMPETEFTSMMRQGTAIIKESCASCHTGTTAKGKWHDGLAHHGQPVVLWKNGRLADDINWDRVMVMTTTKRMPEGNVKLSPQATVLLAKIALNVQAVAASNQPANQPPPAGDQGGDPKNVPPPAPKPDVNY